VIELSRRPPGILGVAGRAIPPELTPMRVHVTGSTVLAEAQEGLVEVLHQDGCLLSRGYLLFVVTSVAGQRPVFSFQRVTRLRVIESGATGLGPANQFKIPPHVLLMTTDAVGISFRPVDNLRMEPPLVIQPLTDFHMARRALELLTSES
jgi:hypothetical protein